MITEIGERKMNNILTAVAPKLGYAHSVYTRGVLMGYAKN